MVADDFALRQCFLQLVNLSLGDVGVVIKIQPLQMRELPQTFYRSQFIVIKIQIR